MISIVLSIAIKVKMETKGEKKWQLAEQTKLQKYNREVLCVCVRVLNEFQLVCLKWEINLTRFDAI